MKQKIRKIVFGRALFITWTPKRVVVGRPGSKRHVTIEERTHGINFHLTNERFPRGHHRRNRHFADLRFDRLKALEHNLEQVAVPAFVRGLVPVSPEEFEDAGFKLMTVESMGMSAVRAVVKSRIRPNLRLRAPSEDQLMEIVEHAAARLRPMSDLDSLTQRSPGTVSAVLLDDEDCISWQLFHYPHGLIHPDGHELVPGWYAQTDRDGMIAAQAQALMNNIGPKFFVKIERLLRFFGIEDFQNVSAVELEDLFRRLAAGETIDSIRAERFGESATST